MPNLLWTGVTLGHHVHTRDASYSADTLGLVLGMELLLAAQEIFLHKSINILVHSSHIKTNLFLIEIVPADHNEVKNISKSVF